MKHIEHMQTQDPAHESGLCNDQDGIYLLPTFQDVDLFQTKMLPHSLKIRIWRPRREGSGRRQGRLSRSACRRFPDPSFDQVRRNSTDTKHENVISSAALLAKDDTTNMTI